MADSVGKVTNLTSYRVIYGDTDQMGVVYYANYLRWFERGRSEFLRQINLPYSTVEKTGYRFPVATTSCRYIQSACLDDLVEIETKVMKLGPASLVFHYCISRETDRSLLVTGLTRHACIDHRGQLTRIPKILQEPLAKTVR